MNTDTLEVICMVTAGLSALGCMVCCVCLVPISIHNPEYVNLVASGIPFGILGTLLFGILGTNLS